MANSDGEIRKISNFRRILPQVLGSCAKNLMIMNVGEIFGFQSIVIPALLGVSNDLNPNETLRITAVQASWLTHPFGSLLSGPICDKIGRRKAIMLVNIPIVLTWLLLGFAESFSLLCFGFAMIGFGVGLGESPSVSYVSEISEVGIRGMLMTISTISLNLGTFSVLALGSIFPWRQVSFICAAIPVICFIAVFFIPESPRWLLSKDRLKEAQKSLQWLRGWVNLQTVLAEFTDLQNFSNSSNACLACEKQSVKCYHSKPTLLNKIKDLKRKRNVKPTVLMFFLQFFYDFSAMVVWQPYIIQIFNAFGTPINSNLATVLSSSLAIVACIFLISTVKLFGRRNICLTSSLIVAFCCFGLSVYGFVLLPPGWTSFSHPDESPPNFESIQQMVGNYSYLALAMILMIQFCTRIGLAGIITMYIGEIFPFKLRTFLCGLSMANHHILISIATKTYYNIEMWLSLSGAILFYGVITLIGFIVMYFIMPELEQRSLEDIELHYSDNSKSLTDISIPKHSKVTQ